MTGASRDHGGGLDAAIAEYGGTHADWIDLSTGINPVPYPLPALEQAQWTALPDRDAQTALIEAARRFWNVPEGATVLAAPGASALIAKMPALAQGQRVAIPGPTYNEHAAAFRTHGFEIASAPVPDLPHVVVHPNNPDGRFWSADYLATGSALTVIDESFCDVAPSRSHIALTDRPGVVVLKSFGKFWGLAGLRLGFAIAASDSLTPLVDALGPWPVSGPALAIGTAALRDKDWADATRVQLREQAARLDALMAPHGKLVGGTELFRLYDTCDARAMQERLARSHIWSRIFPYSTRWLRLGLPPPDRWAQLEAAL